jgi:hypothetical protein
MHIRGNTKCALTAARPDPTISSARSVSTQRQSNWETLVRYCQDSNLEIDNNGAERSLRGAAVSRRNWALFGSDNGGHTAVVLSSCGGRPTNSPEDQFAPIPI